VNPELGKQLFQNVLDSLQGKVAPREGSALDILIGGHQQAPEEAPPAAESPPRPIGHAFLLTADGERLPLAGDQASIGRRANRKGPQPDLDLSPYDPLLTVSRRHAVVDRTAKGYLLTVESDPPPTNPVLIDGESVPPGEARPLAAGAHIQVGLVELRFDLES